ncbi:hypothetical protein [Leptospira stimsonii]|nr:hypothetical protein [Leptospira stimsonii]
MNQDFPKDRFETLVYRDKGKTILELSDQILIRERSQGRIRFPVVYNEE